MGKWEGEMPPIVYMLLQKLGGRVEFNDEDMTKFINSKYTMRTWYDGARCVSMYELVDNSTVDGEVVEPAAELGERSARHRELGSGRNDGLG